jgi:hypothetical protein
MPPAVGVGRRGVLLQEGSGNRPVGNIAKPDAYLLSEYKALLIFIYY